MLVLRALECVYVYNCESQVSFLTVLLMSLFGPVVRRMLV